MVKADTKHKPKEQADQTATLVDQLLKADATTLAAIDQQLQGLQQEIDDFVGVRRQRIESLKVLRKVIDVQVNGRPTKGATEGPTKMEIYAEKIRQLLDREGSMPIPAIAASLHRQQFQTVREAERRSPSGWRVAMAEALASAFVCAIGGVVVFLAFVGVCKLVEDWSADDVWDPTEPRE